MVVQIIVDFALHLLVSIPLIIDTVITIRAATDKDIPKMVGWAQAMAWETEKKTLCADRLTAGISAGLADPDKARYFIAMRKHSSAGTLMLTREWSDWRNGWWWWIQSVYVDPAHRHQGVYRALHQHVLAMATAQADVCGLRLYVEDNNAQAQRTYQSLDMHDAHYRVYEQTIRSIGSKTTNSETTDI